MAQYVEERARERERLETELEELRERQVTLCCDNNCYPSSQRNAGASP